jgi:hypothetical protein
MIGGEMEDDIDALHRGARHTGFAQIRLQEIYLSGAQMVANIAEISAGQIIDDANFFCTACEKMIGERRADKRRSSRYENSLSRPKPIRSRHAL